MNNRAAVGSCWRIIPGAGLIANLQLYTASTLLYQNYTSVFIQSQHLNNLSTVTGGSAPLYTLLCNDVPWSPRWAELLFAVNHLTRSNK
ncbi:hypothetical protein SKAU_G00119270 [Synaphobranchus kaupii]|uniref:Uncharacterized protein n=1 Tax=Synaphobranchus kaupii TaxID=118154 RepID=A0A9Q1J1W1_SYNKA|nr:hypothetical protein SKAU_G00119270 [Synaphobranchus kaupii]